jgi:hypothetical protein
MYSLKIWCNDENEWRQTDIKQWPDKGQMKVGRTLDKNGKTRRQDYMM